MAKFSIGCLAGAIAALLATAHFSLIGFVLGVLLSIAIAGVALGSVRRIRLASEFLGRVADLWDTRPRRKSKSPVSIEQSFSGVECDVISALVNFGLKKPEAESAMRRLQRDNLSPGDRKFDDLFKLALVPR